MEERKHFFFSYAREDTEFVLRLAKELRAVGAKLWLDQLDIFGGQHWDRAVKGALETSEGAAVKRKIAAAQRARWASLRRGNPATRSAKPAAKAKKKAFSSATRAKLSAKLKAYWAAKRAGKK